DPCVDFYRFACGSWMDQHPIPADRSTSGRFVELADRNEAALHEILESASAAPAAETRQVGDYYAACMSEQTIDAKGRAPLEPLLAPMPALSTIADLPPLLAALHEIGVNAWFQFGAAPDYEDAANAIAVVAPGGLGLPDRDYYFREDSKSTEIRQQYSAHVS